LFTLLEGFTDSMGGWKHLPENAHLLEQPEPVIDDLLQWKFLTSIIEKMNRKKEENKRQEHANAWE